MKQANSKNQKKSNRIMLLSTVALASVLVFQQCDTTDSYSSKTFVDSVERKLAGSEFIQTQALPSGVDPREYAVLLYRRVVGVGVSYDSPIISTMSAKIQAGDIEGAAQDAINNDRESFLAVNVRNFASKKFSLNKSAELNDYITTIIGITKDNDDAREMLTADTYYRQNITLNATQERQTIYESNTHYRNLASAVERSAILGNNQVTFSNSLIKVPQMARTADQTLVTHPDPAGVLSSRAFLANSVEAGTNRAAVELALLQFGCVSSTEWKDLSAPDAYVGQDIPRYPDGDNANYTGNCKGCHSILDSLRPAFAKFDLSLNTPFVKHADVYPNARLSLAPFTNVNDGNFAATSSAPGSNTAIPIAQKYNHNSAYPYAYWVTSDRFDNQAIYGKNADWFGWNGSTQGNGLADFGAMLANSDAFSRCLVMQVYETVCERPYTEIPRSASDSIAREFILGGYNIEKLFTKVARVPSCIGWE